MFVPVGVGVAVCVAFRVSPGWWIDLERDPINSFASNPANPY